MFGNRLKQFRLARGMSLDDLVAAIGGVVTKNALSKYERNLMKPSLTVLSKIAKAFETKIVLLQNEPELSTSFIAYRKGSGLGKKEQEKLENLIKTELEDRIRLQEKFGNIETLDLPIKKYEIKKLEDAELAAENLRIHWNLSNHPISNLTALLESHNVHVLLKNTHSKFDGISSVIKDKVGNVIAAAVVSRLNITADRQRLNIAHELGHLVLKVSKSVDEEKAAFRFAGAFLAPRESLIRSVGQKRSSIQLHELLNYKEIYGMSIQALIYRLSDIEIISMNYSRRLFQIISQKGWRMKEPGELELEQPRWLDNIVMRAYSEKLISATEANLLLNREVFNSENISLKQKKEFVKLKIEDRNKLLSRDAEGVKKYYDTNSEWKEFSFGDIIDY